MTEISSELTSLIERSRCKIKSRTLAAALEQPSAALLCGLKLATAQRSCQYIYHISLAHQNKGKGSPLVCDMQSPFSLGSASKRVERFAFLFIEIRCHF